MLRWRKQLRGMLLNALVCMCLAFGSRGLPAQNPVGADEVKAPFVYYFAKFVEWPRSALGEQNLPILIRVLDDDDFARVLENTLAGKTVRGRSFEVKRFASPRELKVCHILFIGRSQEENVKTVLGVLESAPVLTVAEVEDFTQYGGVIELFLEDRKFRFDINVRVARRVGLHISSHLLELARKVERS